MVKSKNKKSRIKLYRRCLQLLTALCFILIPWLNARHINFVYGNFLSFSLAGFPLADPLAVLQIYLKNAYISVDLIIGAVVAVILAIVFGTVFCSWVCPFGLLSDIGQTLNRKQTKTAQFSDRTVVTFIIKFVIFLLGMAGLFLFSTTPVLNQLSMPAWYSRIFQFIFVQQFFSLAIVMILIVLAVEIFVKQRLWCRYVCPQSVLLILLKQINPRRLQVSFDPARCYHPAADREPCTRSCNLDLDPKKFPDGFELTCTNCGDCIVACSTCGKALQFKFKR